MPCFCLYMQSHEQYRLGTKSLLVLFRYSPALPDNDFFLLFVAQAAFDSELSRGGPAIA